MLLLARDAETGEGMSDRQLHDEVLTIILAGHETTAVALSWAWYLLARHPEVERKLADELAGALGGRAPSFGDLPNLPYTKMAIEETMRLYPPSWIMGRQAKEDDEIRGYHPERSRSTDHLSPTPGGVNLRPASSLDSSQ